MVNDKAVSGRPELRSLTLEQAHAAIRVLGRLSEAFRARREQLAESVGLSDQQWEVLERISTEHFMPSLFAEERASSAAAVSKIIRQLVDKGLVTVSVAPGDARHRRYELTARGKRVIAKLRKGREDAIESVWLTFEPAELVSFTDVGEQIARRLSDYAKHQQPR
jgi:DNA-binding MarR family transcriptional regulator